MKKTIALLIAAVGCLLCCRLQAQFLLLDDMEGNGPCSGRWTYYSGSTTGKVEFGVANPQPSGLNTSTLVAKFTKDTSCFEYMSAGCNLSSSFDLSSNSVFKMLVYSSTKDEIMFKLQPGSDYTKAVYFTYKVNQINRWEEASFDFQSVKNRTDFNRIEVHFIDGKKANGILYFDLVQAPNPKGITLTNISIPMGYEDGTVLQAKLNSDTFRNPLNAANWVATNLPPGVAVGNVQRVNDTMATITLSGNSPVNYSRTLLKLQVSSQELQHPNTTAYTAKGNVVFEGNPNWTMIFNDEFNTDGMPDRTKWYTDPRPKGWINGEQQVYTDSTRDNARVRNGNLVITGKKDFPTGVSAEPWSSARLITQGKMDFLYGKVEVRARLPRARGSWPAIWLMPASSVYGNWPQSGELDVMEHVGNNFGTVLSTVHTQSHNWTNGGQLSGTRYFPDADTAFHVYGMEWSADSVKFIFDNVNFFSYVNPHTSWKDWPFDQKFYLILNLAIGGGMGGSITEADWPDSMLVDYVRVYQKGLGTPVLDSVSVTPADVLLLPGKAVQYTAKAYDQNGKQMNPAFTWSITGSGNSITAGGLATILTSGVVTATATVDTTTRQGSTNVNVRPTNYKTIPAKIQAEHSDNSNTCCTEPTADIGGGMNISYIGAGTWMEYDLNVPDSAQYRIQFRVAVNNASSLKVLLDTTTLTTVNLPVSGGWQNWITISSAPVTLKAGQQTIRVYANAYGWNFNWLNIIPADSVHADRIAITPDNAKIYTGSAQQFTATGYDQFNDLITLSPAPVWMVTGSRNSISSSGLLIAGDSSGTYTVTAALSNTLFKNAAIRIAPVPVLTRIAITPDSSVVPAGAGQQFTATGYDQNDSIYTFTPAWSVTGSGNRISSNGLLTAGNTTGNYIVKASGRNDSVTATAHVNVAYTCTVSNQYEAESASNRSTGPVLETCTDVGGGQNFKNLSVNDFFAYNTLNVPSTGVYTISVRVLTTATAKLWVGHSGMNFGTITIPNTGGVWKTIKDTMTLPALSYTGIHVQSGTFKFNWFSIDNCAAPPQALHHIVVSPASTTLGKSQTLQLTATGYDSSNNVMPLASPVWSVTGSNTISTSGLLTTGNTAGSYTVTVTSGNISGTAAITIQQCTLNSKYEAESASNRSPGPWLQTCTDTGGGQNFTGLVANDWFAYSTLNVPAGGVYRVSVRVSTTATAKLWVGHSGMTFGTISLPNTNGAWQTISDTMTLPALTYTGIHVQSGTFKFNWFSIDNCDTATGSSGARIPAVYTITADDRTEDVQVYPNPVQQQITIRTGNTDTRSVSLLDTDGKIIRIWNMQKGSIQLVKDISFLHSGLYFIRLQGSYGNKTLRFVKQ